ncbi:MAG: hypothetical protein ACRDXC_05185, partial [Acidimicrobiales bacterium]
TTVLIGQDIFPENRSMGSGISLGLANGVGSVLVLVAGLWVSGQGDILTLCWVVAALSAASTVFALTFPGELVRRSASEGAGPGPRL